jgi:hypothetical protein
MQAGVAPPQTIPHPPQLPGSKLMFEQAPKQFVNPAGQTTSLHSPPLQ